MTSDVVQLPVAFRDARAADLGLHLGLPPQPALATLTVEGDGWSAELRILGASHQVLIERGGRTVCSETVACHLPGEGHRLAPLPTRLVSDEPHVPNRQRLIPASSGSAYEFRSGVVRLAATAFHRQVEDLLARHGDDGRALCARFPGDELGATALRVETDGVGTAAEVSWRTWHTYPRTGEVVTTSSRQGLASPAAAGPA